MTEMEEMKVATIVQLINQEAAKKGITKEVEPDNLVKLPNKRIYYMGMPCADVYAARVDYCHVCLVYVQPDGEVDICFHQR